MISIGEIEASFSERICACDSVSTGVPTSDPRSRSLQPSRSRRRSADLPFPLDGPTVKTRSQAIFAANKATYRITKAAPMVTLSRKKAMRTDKQIEASRTNGAKSQGPRHPKAKRSPPKTAIATISPAATSSCSPTSHRPIQSLLLRLPRRLRSGQLRRARPRISAHRRILAPGSHQRHGIRHHRTRNVASGRNARRRPSTISTPTRATS